MMKKVLTTAIFAFAASSVFATNADVYTILDEDKDGLISKDEASISQMVSQQWDTLDKNQDGYLDAEEFSILATYVDADTATDVDADTATDVDVDADTATDDDTTKD